MLSYIARRLGFLIFVIIGVTLLIFTISYIVPADPAQAAAGLDAREEQVEALRKMMGLDQPVHIQYARYLWGLLHLDLGRSTRSLRPVSSDIAHYLPATLELVIAATLLYIVVGLPLGILSAVKRGTFIDRFSRIGVLSGIAMPEFWLALILQYVFFGQLGILPSISRLPAGMPPPERITGLYTIDSLFSGDWTTLGASLRHMILPAVCLAVGRVAILVRITRRCMITALQEDYVRTARAKGLSEGAVIWRHAFRNVLVPVITIIGLQVGWLLNTTLVVEMVFAWPGIGWYAVESIAYWDYMGVMAVALVVAVGFVLINMIVDVLYVAVDPRVKI